MANRCATLDEFLAQAPDFGNVGPSSSVVVAFTGLPLAGETFEVRNSFVLPETTVILTATGGVPAADEFLIGADAAETAANFAGAINLATNAINTLVTAGVEGASVTVVSKLGGPNSRYPVASTLANAVLSASALDGGEVQVQFALDCACKQLSADCWGDKMDCGHIYLTAHMLTVSAGNEQGPTDRKKIDKIEIEYASISAGTDSTYGSTHWGRLYMMLKRSLPPAVMVARRFLPRLPFRCG